MNPTSRPRNACLSGLKQLRQFTCKYDYCINGDGDTAWDCSCKSPDCRKCHLSGFFHLPLDVQAHCVTLLEDWFVAEHRAEGVTYRYSGLDYTALPWTATMLEIKEKIEAVQGEYNYCLLNRYRSGSDSVGWRSDDEPETGNIIGSVSLGATRNFRIRHNVTRETKTFSVSNGTLIIMAGTMQQFWKHDVPKTKEHVGERINLTFRKITN